MRAALLLLVTLTACDDGRARLELEDPAADSVVVVAPDDTDALTAAYAHLRDPECLPVEEEAEVWSVVSACSEEDATPFCWAGSRCIQVVYQADDADYLPAIQRALDTWEAFPCSDVCFEAPRPVDFPAGFVVDAINFGPVVMPHLVKPPSDAYLQVRPVVTLDIASSEIYRARVGWHRGRFPADDPCVEPIMLRAVALALGVEDSGVPSPSLLGLDVFRLTTHDQAAFCAKYGAGGACGR